MFNIFGRKKTLHDLLTMKMREALDAEEQISMALPKMAEAATDPSLKKGFEEHIKQTEDQADRVKRAFESIGETPNADRAPVFRNLISEGEDIIDIDDPKVRDAGLIAGAKSIEENEIVMYETMADWAREMGHKEVASMFRQTLGEEQETKQRLDSLSKSLYSNATKSKFEG
jgi:ferritin-like metal-binding protein YciE